MALAVDTLADLLPWWVEVRCTCGRSAAIPVQLLAERHGRTARLPVLVAAMRCQSCGRRPPGEAALVENPQVGAQGYVGGRRVLRRPIRP